MRISTLCLSLLLAAILVSQATAQGFFRDFVINNPRQYSPDDPWTTGVIFRNRVGWGGLFFNCDGEECKRHSPYIEWNRQSTCYHRKAPIASSIGNQLFEIRRRIRWGACCDDECCADCAGCAQCGGAGGYYADNSDAAMMAEEVATEPEQAVAGQKMLPMEPAAVADAKMPAALELDEYSHGGVKVMPAQPPRAPQTPVVPRVSEAVDGSQSQPARTSNRDEKFRMLR